MKVYLEVIVEQEGQNPTLTQIDVTDFDQTQYDAAVAELKSVQASGEGESAIVRKHECFHDEQPPKPCKVTFL